MNFITTESRVRNGGVRRYQNKDGSLTSAGKKRNSNTKSSKKSTKSSEKTRKEKITKVKKNGKQYSNLMATHQRFMNDVNLQNHLNATGQAYAASISGMNELNRQMANTTAVNNAMTYQTTMTNMSMMGMF